jgi:hypothetical protein
MRISPKHLPVLVTGNKRYLLNGKPCFKKAACTLMAKIVEMKVFDL